MSSLDGRTAVVTGAGAGLGREHALLFAAHGALVVVNDVAADAAQSVVDEITTAGGTAIACPADVTSWDGAAALIDTAVQTYGDLHVLVNNAGIVRDGMIVNLTEDNWDRVVGVHLKGHAATIHHAAVHWRGRQKAGELVNASIISTTSGAGILNNPGQANYSSAKAGIVALTLVAAKELGRYGVRANAIAPLARTQMTTATPGLGDMFAAPESGFDPWHPGNVSPLVGYLAGRDCAITGAVFHVAGGQVAAFNGWTTTPLLDGSGRWSIDDIAAKLDGHPALSVGEGGHLPAEGMSPKDFQKLIAQTAATAGVRA